MIHFNPKRDIGIKIIKYVSLPKCISTVRRYREAPLGEIKAEIESADFVITCDFADSSGLHSLIACHDELSRNGNIVSIQEQDRIITRDILQNLFQMHKDIHEETLAEIEAESVD